MALNDSNQIRIAAPEENAELRAAYEKVRPRVLRPTRAKSSVTSIGNPAVIGKILAHLGLGSSAPLAMAHPPRAPPSQAPLDLR
jgi:hypothetical protein